MTFKAISNFSNNCNFPKSRLLAMNQDKNFNSFLRSEAKKKKKWQKNLRPRKNFCGKKICCFVSFQGERRKSEKTKN